MGFEVVLLNDNLVFGDYGSTRYIGPYVLASQLNAVGIKTVVVDYFTNIKDPLSYLSSFLSTETLVVGISSTFLFPSKENEGNSVHRSEGINDYYKGELWFKTGEELLSWSEQVKKLLQEKSPACKLVLGGVKAQFAHWRPQFYQHFDNIFFGASDFSIIDYVNSLKTNTQNERFIKQDLALKNKATCPVTQHSSTSAIRFKEALPIEISRGCLYDCKFCHYEKKSSIRKDLQTLKDEMTYNYEHFGTTVYQFCDDCFNDTRKKLEETCNAFLQLPFKIEWVAYARPDVAVKFPETVDLMLASGARGLYWGIESFDFEAAKNAGKGTHPDLIKDFFLSYKQKFRGNCITEGSFIVGLPGEEESSLHKSLEWLLQNDVFDFLSFGPLGIMPYSENLDQIVFDYAAYSKDPTRYGFSKVEFGERKYWEHKTMNSIRANEIAGELTAGWRKVKQSTRIFKSIWLYPHFRTLGYSHEEIIGFMNPAVDAEMIRKEIKARFLQHRSEYHETLMTTLFQKPR